jgi:hypothetical protein
MTIGQLFECVFSKVAALRGEMIDATPFNNFDFNKITSELKEYGFNEHGYEHLYCGMTGKKILSKIFIGPTFYLRLKHMVQDKIHCLTLDHDVLTKNGWKKYNELTIQDSIATLNKDTNKLEYNKPHNILYYENYNGQMYRIKKTNVDLNVTTNHRMLVSQPLLTTHNETNTQWSNYDYELAGDIVDQQRRYKKDAQWETEQFIPDILSDLNIEMNTLLINLGKWIKGYIEFESEQLKSYLAQFALDQINKFLPDWVMKLNQHQSQLLITNIIDENEFNTQSIKLADQIQQLCLHAGWASNIKSKHDMLYLNVMKNNCNPIINQSHDEIDKIEEIYDYNGPVFCLEVPNETFYVRRNGIPVWTANSRATGPRQRLTRQPPEGRRLSYN